MKTTTEYKKELDECEAKITESIDHIANNILKPLLSEISFDQFMKIIAPKATKDIEKVQVMIYLLDKVKDDYTYGTAICQLLLKKRLEKEVSENN